MDDSNINKPPDENTDIDFMSHIAYPLLFVEAMNPIFIYPSSILEVFETCMVQK